MVRLDSIGNKFEFITIAAERCKQLQRGARARIESISQKSITVAQEEVLAGVSEVPTEPYAVDEGVVPGE
jgi:DNA-directed RNA polymerase omega subunit